MTKMAGVDYCSEPSCFQGKRVRVKSYYSSVILTLTPVENGESLPCLPLWIFGASLSGWCGGHVTITHPEWYYCLGRTIVATRYLLV